MKLCLLFGLVLAAVACVASQPLPTTCSGVQNTRPVIDFSPTAGVTRTVANGTLTSVLADGSKTPLLVLHVYGDSYSMGVAYGQLLKAEMGAMMPEALRYVAKMMDKPMADMLDYLDLTINVTRPYTPKWHFEFLQGMADATIGSSVQVTFTDVLRIAMIPEAIKATCSIIGAWGGATANGGLLQLRALDWGTDGPFQQWPLLATFHPDDGSFTHSSLGWVGLYGTLTGFSSSNLGVSEKVWYGYQGEMNIAGYPWTLMLHDMMRWDIDIDAALARIAQGPRTCAIWVGLGQGARPNPRNPKLTQAADFKLVSDGYQEVKIYNPENFPVYPPSHDYFPQLLFVNKHVQPSTGDVCMNDLMHRSYGSFVAADMYTTVTALQKTGDMHIAVLDFDAKTMTISNASPGPDATPAYENGFVRFDMKALWTQPLPVKKKQRGNSRRPKLALE